MIRASRASQFTGVESIVEQPKFRERERERRQRRKLGKRKRGCGRDRRILFSAKEKFRSEKGGDVKGK